MKLNIITLGCSKNLVDSEHLAGRVEAAGWDVVFDRGLDRFDDSPRFDDDRSSETSALNRCRRSDRVVVVNTCGFIGDAKAESIDTILELAAAKTRGEIDRLYVIGCLSERYADELREELPEVDAFFGARGIDGIVAALGAETSRTFDEPLARPRKISTPPHFAYLKISEGCDRRCGFCAIPLIRGPHVSVPEEELVAEAQSLAAKGVKELIVIAQDITFYGLDIYGERKLAELLKRLARIDGIEWIRLHYAYPAGFPQDVIDVMRTEPKICKYLDIPLQHISEGQLASMKRGLGAEGTRKLVEDLRARIPGLALRTTMLVGYPGETREDFEQLLEFVREARFERLGVFPYSAEEGTFSADELADDVPEEVKQARVEELMRVQAEISAELNAARVGGTERVIVDRWEPSGDGPKDGFWVCRSQWDSPEVDTEILLSASEDALAPGQFVRVKITGATEYDLTAELRASV